MSLKIEKATPTVGAVVTDVDVDHLLGDDAMPKIIMDAAEEHGALVFPELRLDDASQAAFFAKLGEVVRFDGYEIPEVMVITLDPDNPNSEYFPRQRAVAHRRDPGPQAGEATVLTAHRVSPEGGETEFVSTYAAYDALTDDEKARFEQLRVVHTLEAIQRKVYPNPTPEQEERWRRKRVTELPLVWTHGSGRKSLVLGGTADHIVGMDVDEGRALLDELLERATQPERVYQHTWSVGDTVMWDNTGTLHRAMPYDPASRREMHRTTIVGSESIAYRAGVG